jgi:hypothetical protein
MCQDLCGLFDGFAEAFEQIGGGEIAGGVELGGSIAAIFEAIE